jgi:spore germination cell wall hydrolase CwlJ-like protein
VKLLLSILVVVILAFFAKMVHMGYPLKPEIITAAFPEPIYLFPEYKEDRFWGVSYSSDDILCLQKNIFFEARNQSDAGKIAIAWVTLNRVKHENYENTICGVVYQGVHKDGIPVKHLCAFSWYCDKFPDKPENNIVELRAWEKSRIIAENIIKNCLDIININCPQDPTDGALFYFNPKLANPVWAGKKIKTTNIGDHAFYRYAN